MLLLLYVVTHILHCLDTHTPRRSYYYYLVVVVVMRITLTLVVVLNMLRVSRAFAPITARSSSAAAQMTTTIRLASASSTDEKTSTAPIVNENAYDECSMEDIVSLCKRRGIIFPSSEIYNGYAGFYDYGPLGAELKKNVKDAWWKYFVQKREDVVGLDSSIIHNPTTWKSSGEYQSCDSLHYVSVDIQRALLDVHVQYAC